MRIQPYQDRHLAAIVHLSLRAWAPVFDSIERVMNPEVYREFYPAGWRVSQQQAVETVCVEPKTRVWVAEESGSAVGFVATKVDSDSRLGEIYMIAVDPDFQHQGYGSALIDFALDRLKDAGMTVAMVDTGGDPGHAPARHTHEKMGFGLLPIARYFKKL